MGCLERTNGLGYIAEAESERILLKPFIGRFTMKRSALLLSALITLLILAPASFAQDTQQAELDTSTGWEFFEAGQFEDAVSEFESALGNDPAHFSAGNGLGEAAIKIQNWPKAKRGFEIAHKAQPENCTVKAKLAYVEMRLKHRARARDLYEEVVGSTGCNPNDNYSRMQLGIIYSKAKTEEEKDRAIQLFNQILNSD